MNEVTLGLHVLTAPRFFIGTHGKHEAFDTLCDDGSARDGQHVQVIDNVDIAPQVPVRPGDHIEVRGDLVDDPKGTIVHWTHHDPHGHHPDGYIRFNGMMYA